MILRMNNEATTFTDSESEILAKQLSGTREDQDDISRLTVCRQSLCSTVQNRTSSPPRTQPFDSDHLHAE